MNAQIAAELLKLRTTRTLLVATCVAVAFAALIPALATGDPDRFGVSPLEPGSLADMMHAPAHVVAGATLIVGILAATSEHTHRTVLSTRLVQPQPARVLAAKVMALAIAGAGIGALAEAAAVAVGSAGLARNGVTVDLPGHGGPGAAVAVVLLAAGFGALGTAIGTIVRNSAAAVGLTLIWALAVENLLPGVMGRADLGRWLPGSTIDHIVTPQPGGLTPAMAALVLACYTLIAIVLASFSDTRRDP